MRRIFKSVNNYERGILGGYQGTSHALGNMAVFDGTTEGTLYPQIVQVKHAALESSEMLSTQVEGKPLDHLFEQDPFFFVKFEANPLDERADSAVTMRMRHMEIIYHRGYVEAIYKFFKPPASQLGSVEALLVSRAFSSTVDGVLTLSRALPLKLWRVFAKIRGRVSNMPYRTTRRSTSRWT